jgi:pyruvate kinase
MSQRRAKIVCTIGPASSSPARLEELMGAGMNIARLNFSHGDHAEHARVIGDLREISRRTNRPVAILQDLQGPKIRLGPVAGDQVPLERGSTINLTTRSIEGDSRQVSITYKEIAADLKPGDQILVSDGLLRLEVREIDAGDIRCEVLDGGQLRSRAGINLPGANLSLPALTEKDVRDLSFGIEQGVDWVALSFVRKASDVANAIVDRTDALMLSGETSIGRYPVEAVTIMDRIVKEAEKSPYDERPDMRRRLDDEPFSYPDAMAEAACYAAHQTNARAIVAFTESGFTAQLISKYRPSVPIYAVTPSSTVFRRLCLFWGVEPRTFDYTRSASAMIAQADEMLLREGAVQRGDGLVILAGMPSGRPGTTNLLKLHRAGETVSEAI